MTSTTDTTSPHAALQDFVQPHIPDWLLTAPAADHQAMRQRGWHRARWLTKARRNQPQALQALQHAIAEHKREEQRLAPLLERLATPETFAEPLLKAAIKERLGLDLDVRQHFFFHPYRAQVPATFNTLSSDPLVLQQLAMKAATQTLLASALQNFEAWEAKAGALDVGPVKAAVYDHYPLYGLALSAEPLALEPHRFVALCRELDLGKRYQALIREVFGPPWRGFQLTVEPVPSSVWVLRRFEYTALKAQIHMGVLRGTVDASLRNALLQAAVEFVHPKGPIVVSFPSLWQVTLTGAVLFTHADAQVTVYLPDDPVAALQSFASLQAFHDTLRDRLFDRRYRERFLQRVPARQRAEVTRRLNDALYPQTWNSAAGYYERVAARDASLSLDTLAIEGWLVVLLTEQKRQVVIDDGLFHVVPTAVEDHKSLTDKLLYFASIGLQVLNVAAFFVPVLGQVMLAVTAAQLAYDVYEGVESLAKGERDEAFGYLMDVVQNVALMAAMGAAGASAGRLPAVEAPELVKGMRQVTRSNGRACLWKPDLAPFAHDVVLPAGLKPDALGLVNWNGRRWLVLDGRNYAVKETPWRLKHPRRSDAYEPGLRHNQAGAWLHELDEPLEWEGPTLLRRLGDIATGFSDEVAAQVLSVSGTREATLRRVLADLERPPALLVDTLVRFRVEQNLTLSEGLPSAERQALFAEGYAALAGTPGPAATKLQQLFSGLPVAVAEELVARLDEPGVAALLGEGRLPRALGEEARAYQQEVRLARAYEGLYLQALHNADSERLAAGSPGQVPDRQQARAILGMQPLRPGSRSPLRLANGRPGYPLSGRGRLPGFASRETLLDKLRLLEFEDAHAEDLLAQLERAGLDRMTIDARLDALHEEYQQLQASLAQWHATPPAGLDVSRIAARQRVAKRLLAHWRANNLPEIGRTGRALRLASIDLADFPDELPAFVAARTTALELHDILFDTSPGAVHETGNNVHRIERLVTRFPQLTALTISRRSGLPPFLSGLPQRLAQSLPGLHSLSLDGLGLLLVQNDLASLRTLPALRRLDLSGNVLTQEAGSLQGWHLDYLGLARTGVSTWPTELDAMALGTIGEVSLEQNSLTSLPEFLISNASSGGTPTRVRLHGNILTRETLRRARVAEWAGSRYRFGLDLYEEVAQEIQALEQERAQLSEELERQASTSSSSQALPEEIIEQRRNSNAVLMQFWCDVRGGSGVPALSPRDIAYMPRHLPRFFSDNVRSVSVLQDGHNGALLDNFLRQLPNLQELRVSGETGTRIELPMGLTSLMRLCALDLSGAGRVVDQGLVTFLGNMPVLSQLVLDGNDLSGITDFSALAHRPLELLSLDNTGLEQWPGWLTALLPDSLENLSLVDNRLTGIPEDILLNPLGVFRHVDLDLRGNPLSRESMIRAHLSNRVDNTYNFEMDLPDDIQAMARSPHASDLDSDSDEPEDLGLPVLGAEPWLGDNAGPASQRAALWAQLGEAGDAPHLLGLVDRLRYTADFRQPAAQAELVSRVWEVLEAADRDAPLRLVLNGMAEEPLRRFNHQQTCADGVRLEFNQMEVQVYLQQALRNVEGEQRGTSLYRLMRQLYRLQALDDLARAQAGSRDEAEVRLAYRLRWSRELDLPLPPRRMLYENIANVTPAELDSVLRQVQQGEGGQGFMDYAGQRDFWLDYLREAHAARFQALKARFEEEVLALLDRYPEDTPDQYSDRVRAMEVQFKEDERQLVRELTVLEGRAT